MVCALVVAYAHARARLFVAYTLSSRSLQPVCFLTLRSRNLSAPQRCCARRPEHRKVEQHWIHELFSISAPTSRSWREAPQNSGAEILSISVDRGQTICVNDR